MHSSIYEIKAEPIEREDWAGENDICDSDFRIDGVDYWCERDKASRVEHIDNFFNKWFPDNSFDVIENEENKTAIVEFVGDIEALYAKWRGEIQSAAGALSIDGMTDLGIFRVRQACNQPFELSSKFYQEDWNGCTVDADDFLSFLRYLSKQNDGKPFKLYIGQVFDYHF